MVNEDKKKLIEAALKCQMTIGGYENESFMLALKVLEERYMDEPVYKFKSMIMDFAYGCVSRRVYDNLEDYLYGNF